METYKEKWERRYEEQFGTNNGRIDWPIKMVKKKKRGRKPGVKVGPYKKHSNDNFDFNINEYLSPATLRYLARDIENAIKNLNIKLKIINRHLEQLKGK